MVDVIFRDIDAETLHRLLGVVRDLPHEVHDPAGPAWTADLAEKVLRLSTRRAARVTRALVDNGGEVTAAAARQAAGIAPHHAAASLTASWKKLARFPDGHDVHTPVPDRLPHGPRRDRRVHRSPRPHR